MTIEAPTWPHTGVILAGGQSRRMGQPKEGVVLWDGRPMIAHIIDVLRAVCRRVVVVGECRGFVFPSSGDISQLSDVHPGQGPLAGIETMLASGLDDRYLIIACDQPLLTSSLLHLLTRRPAPVPRVFRAAPGQPLCPFPGVYPTGWLPAVQDALARDARSVCRLLVETSCMLIPLPSTERFRLQSLNTPDEVAACWSNMDMHDHRRRLCTH